MSRMAVLAAALALAAGCTTQVQHGLDERAANELQTVLAERGFEAHKVLEPGKKPTWAIEVADDRATDAVRVLAELGLPRPRLEGFAEVFGKGSLVPTPAEERALYLEALSGELSRTLESVEGVTAARVHLVLPAPPRPGAEPTAAKASAYVRVRPGRAPQVAAMREQLRTLVAGGVEGLSPEAVTLVIDAVESSVPTVPVETSAPTRLRILATVLGVALSAVAIALVVAMLKFRELRRGVTPAPAPARPVVATAARKVA